MLQPTVLQPDPDPAFVRELAKIDPALRVVWGWERYLRSCWVIERKLSPERYWAAYASLFEEGHPRFVNQPIYDHSKPLFDEDGNPAGWQIVGYQHYDLAPEWEWVQFITEPDGSSRPLDARTVLALKRAYAWDRFHSISRAKLEKKLEDERKTREEQQKLAEIVREGVEQAWYEHDKIVTLDVGPTRLEGTEV